MEVTCEMDTEAGDGIGSRRNKGACGGQSSFVANLRVIGMENDLLATAVLSTGIEKPAPTM